MNFKSKPFRNYSMQYSWTLLIGFFFLSNFQTNNWNPNLTLCISVNLFFIVATFGIPNLFWVKMRLECASEPAIENGEAKDDSAVNWSEEKFIRIEQSMYKGPSINKVNRSLKKYVKLFHVNNIILYSPE